MIPNQTEPVLTLANAQENDAGTYEVIASNVNGSTASRKATLVVENLSARLSRSEGRWRLDGRRGRAYQIQFCNDLSLNEWQYLFELTMVSDTEFFEDDTLLPENTIRFYRAVTTP